MEITNELIQELDEQLWHELEQEVATFDHSELVSDSFQTYDEGFVRGAKWGAGRMLEKFKIILKDREFK